MIGLIKRRHLIQGRLKPEVVDESFDVQAFRDGIDQASLKHTRIPEGVSVQAVDVDGMADEWITAEGAPAEKVMLYIHGGGFISGSCLTHRMHVSKFVKESGIKALLFDYRLAPEHPYPVAIEDCVSAYQWLIGQGYTRIMWS